MGDGGRMGLAATALLAVIAVWAAYGAASAGAQQSTAAPVITSPGPFTVDEGTTSVATLTATDEDTDQANLSWSIPADSAGGPDGGKFSLTTAGALSFSAAKDFENPDDADSDGVYKVTVQVSDGTNTDAADLVVTLGNVTELLSAITGSATVSHAENDAVRVGAYSASSAEDAAGVTWSLSGDDSDDFEIAGGLLRFKLPPPDYESPGDTDADNGYAVTVQAAAGGSSVTLDVTVTVTDVNEAGAVTFSSARPSLGTALTASVADPDSAHTETVTWTWERSRGRTGWAVISGATSASYTPVAADSEHYLRATASYTDRLGSGRSASAVTANPPLAHTLSALAITGSSRAMYPAFTSDVLHYAVECGEGDTMALTWSAADAGTRVAVNDVQRASQNGSLSLTGLTGASDIAIVLSGAAGASTTYVIHCLGEDFPDVTTVKRTGATEGLIGFVRRFDPGQGQWYSHLMIIDNNGVPRYRERIANRVNHFRLHPGGKHPYSYSERDTDPNPPATRDLHSLHVVLDAYLDEVARVWTVPPLRRTDNHDFTITPAGNYVLMSYEPRSRDFSAITDNAGNVLTDDQGQPYGTRTVRDSDIQIIMPGGQQVSLWSSWDHMAIEDCTQHRFPDGYAHINSLQFHDGDVIAAFRGCSKVLRIDPDTGTTVWRVGRSYRTSAQWTASGEPAPLTIVGDPHLEFCGLHSAKIIGNGNLLLFDNGGHCVINPVTGTSMRESAKFARGVEYAIDTVNGEAIFQAHHSLHSQFAHYSLASGHIEAMSNGDWLISWGRALIDNDPNTGKPPDESATQVDPRTNTEKFSITVTQPSNTPLAQRERLAIRAYPIEPVALAPDVGALTASFPASSHTSGTNPGAGRTARAVVAFSRPVADSGFTASSASLSVQGATVASVSAHVVAGEAANAYLVTLTPEGDGAITVSLVAEQACASGGICTADGTKLTEVPDPLVIGPKPAPPPPIFIAPPPPPGPSPSEARLAALHLSGVDIGEFDPDWTGYTGVVGEATETVVTAEAMHRLAEIAIDPPDADAARDGHQVALEGLAAITVTVTSPDGTREQAYRVGLVDREDRPWPHCLLGDIVPGFSLVAYEGGGVDDLAACAESRGVVALYALHEGDWLPYIPEAPDFVNARFRELYADGVPAFTPLAAGSNGPASPSPGGDVRMPRWPECLHGDVGEGYSLVVYKGGGLDDLAACAESRGVAAFHALAGGAWVAYVPGAPDSANRAFAELFAEGLPPGAPLLAEGGGP